VVTRARWVCVVALLFSCSDPIITEDTATGCRNRFDDDGDGLVDCADPSCVASGVCESGEVACRNGTDDDGDGSIDCQQATCVAGGHCDSAEVMCTAAPQSGCLTGQGCYLSFVNGTTTSLSRCRLASASVAPACDSPAIRLLTPRDRHPCIAGSGCLSFGASDGTCTPYCNRDDDCLAGGVCTPNPAQSGHPGLCTVPCNPFSASSCSSERLRCASLHESRSTRFADGGARHSCVGVTTPRGAAALGAECDDPPGPATSSDRICAAGTACVPRADGTRCRALCDVDAPRCPAGLPCQPLYPAGRPVAFRATRYGACTN